MDSTNTPPATGVETEAVSGVPSLPNETPTFGCGPEPKKHGTTARDVETETPGSKRKRAPFADAGQVDGSSEMDECNTNLFEEVKKLVKERNESKRQFRADMADAIGDIEIETERLEQSVTSTEAEIMALKTRLEQLEKQMGWVLEYIRRFA